MVRILSFCKNERLMQAILNLNLNEIKLILESI